MNNFYTNKYPIQGCIQKNGEWSDLPEGNIFTIKFIQLSMFVLEPITKIEGLHIVTVDVAMLDCGFTKTDHIK